MTIEVSNGELIDKVTILQIKREEIQDKQKRANVEREYISLLASSSHLLSINGMQGLYDQLISVNRKLWRIEDSIREKEYIKSFDEEFVQLARSVYITNDERAAIKKQIDKLTNSKLTEEKSYESY
jgi:hypothetical protein